MLNGRFAHWELATLAAAAVLAVWPGLPSVPLAATALVVGAVAVAFAIRPRPGIAVLVAGATLIGTVASLRTSLRVAETEHAWAADTVGLRWKLVAAAGRRLDGDLAGAVTLVRNLADLAESVSELDRRAALDQLQQAIRGPGPERSVMVFDSAGRPWAWAGRHRMPASTVIGLEVRTTPFYAVLSAGRQTAGRKHVAAQVLLAADSVVRDAGEALGEQFDRATGVRLEVFPPGGGPQLADVFDYCVPGCSSVDVLPDTLFSVRLVPPSQGAYRRDVMTSGTRWVTGVAGGLFLLLVLAGGAGTRAVSLAGLALFLAATPAGHHLPFGRVFSSAVYYADLLGPLSASAGGLVIAAVLLFAGAAAVRGAGWRGRAGPVVAGLLLVATPFALRALASGITPPIDGVDPGLWMIWEIALAVAGAAALTVAAVLARLGPMPTGGRATAAGAFLGVVVLVAIGYARWVPGEGLPIWYAALWIPVFACAALPVRQPLALVLVAVVAGAEASVLVWAEAAEGRILQADRDVRAVRQGSDPIALGLLERFGASLEAEAPPRTAAELYQRWQRSPLEADRYPAVLSIWDSAGVERVRLPLAELASLTPPVVRGVAEEAGASGIVVAASVSTASDVHYVLGVPMRDGTVLAVGLGPRTRLIPPVRVARFLRGERVLPAPYTLAFGGATAGAGGAAVRWVREGMVARGEASVALAGGHRRLIAEVPLGMGSSLALRGVLVIFADLVLVALLWALAEHIAGHRLAGAVVRDALGRRSYRRRLAIVFAVFFVVPTVLFSSWVAARLRDEARRTRDIATRQILAEAVGDARDLPIALSPRPDTLIQELSSHLNAELLYYQDSELRVSSAPILAELGAIDWYLRPDVARALLNDAQAEVDVDQRIAGRLTRVGYRDLDEGPNADLVLAAPRLLEDPEALRNEQDVVFGLLVVTLGGVLAALGLAALAARTLATPVQALQRAAEQVGRGEPLAPFPPDAPGEFAPVMHAFERMAHDVRASQEALVAARQRTAAVLRNVATGVVALDEDDRIVTSNPRAEELLGVVLYAGDRLRERSPRDWDPVWEWARAVASGRSDAEPREFTIGHAQIRAQAALLSGAGLGWVVALDDVTDLSRVVRVLAWGELARQIAHEIKNPLTPIRLGIQHLRRAHDASRGDFGDVLDRTSRQILAEIERLDAVARAFSRFGAPPAGQEPLERVDATDIARDTAALYAIGEWQGVAVDAEGSVPVRARRDELKEVLINLVENARAGGASAVTIRVARPGEGGEAEVAVRDDGRGIAAEDLPRVFEPRFSTTTSGAGLGLAICQRLVESWGGQIRVESEPERGTTVRLLLRSEP